jgi:hypothetical protein
MSTSAPERLLVIGAGTMKTGKGFYEWPPTNS